PREYGGQARAPIEEFIFFDEIQRTDFPIPFLTLCAVGPTLAKHGTDEQKALLLPRILRGELHFAIGYTQPEAAPALPSTPPPAWHRCARARCTTPTTTP